MVIYFIGVLVSITILSLILIREGKKAGVIKLTDVFIIIAASIFSWIAVGVVILAAVVNLIAESDNIIIWKNEKDN